MYNLDSGCLKPIYFTLQYKFLKKEEMYTYELEKIMTSLI